jgi:hypothetical protein
VITNDNELRITRERLAQAESILDSCRRDFLPHNEVQYRLFAGSTIDLIQSMRADIDAYLGIGTDTDLAVSLQGEDVSLGSTSAGVITRTIDTFRRGLQTVVGVLHAEASPADAGKRAGWIERLCDLSLAGVGPGSVQVFLDLPTRGDGLFAEGDRKLLGDALSVLFDGLEWAARDGQAIPPTLERLPQPTRLAVLGVVARLMPPQTGPVERIGYRRRSDGPARPTRKATLTRQSRPRVQRAMEQLAADRRFTEAAGVIRQIDLDDQTFELRERPGGEDDLPCEYGDGLAEVVKELLDCRVKVSGLLKTSRMTRKSKLEAEAIEPLGDEEAAEQAKDGTTSGVIG